MIKRIESTQNRFYKRIKALGQKKNRDKEGVFLAEGLRFVSEIPSTWEVDYFFVSDGFLKAFPTEAYEERAVVYAVTNEMFTALSDTEHPQGILAVCKQQEQTKAAVLQGRGNAPFFLLAEGLNDPGNLGTIIRTADACGADGIFLSKGSVDVYHPKVLRATMGSIFHVPVVQNIAIEELLEAMATQQIPVYAAHLDGERHPYALDLKKACAFVIGNEARGLSDEAVAGCEELVIIPMPGQAESLNASIAAAVLLYEVVRQRM